MITASVSSWRTMRIRPAPSAARSDISRCLADARASAQDQDTALLPVEQLYPFPTAQLGDVLRGYPQLQEVVWVQEEERNQGAWLCVRDAIEAALPEAVRLRAVYRPDTASGPTASKVSHYAQQASLVQAVFAQG